MLLLEMQYLRAINKYWRYVKFDLILYSTPPITFNKVICTLKKRWQAKTYLMLKDIFPQNAQVITYQSPSLHSWFFVYLRF